MSSNFSISALKTVFSDSSHDIRRKVIGIYALLIIFNIAAWAVAFVGFSIQYPTLLGVALLAYTFGLRHSVDADHISAIDNVTRKLMQENKRPVAVGFFFSLGHSTVVVALTIAIVIAATIIQTSIPALKNAGGLIGTSVSAIFLFLIAIINMLVLWEIFQMFRKVKRGEEYNDMTLDEFLNQRGLMGRFFRPLLRLVDKSWKMYPVGVLVGLVVGTIEVMSIIAMEFHLSGGIWDYLGNLDFGLLGGIIIGIFIACWAISTIIYKVKRYDDIEVKVAPRPEELVI